MWRAYHLSPWWRRVIAALIDGAIISVIARGLALLLGVGLDDQFAGDSSLLAPSSAPLLVVLFTLTVTGLYLPPTMVITDGRTIGKLVLGIRVVREDEQPMTIGRATFRELVVKEVFIGLLPIVYFILIPADALFPLVDKENRAIHDFMARTRVVKQIDPHGCLRHRGEWRDGRRLPPDRYARGGRPVL